MSASVACVARLCRTGYLVVKRKIGCCSFELAAVSPSLRTKLLTYTKTAALCSVVHCTAKTEDESPKLQIPQASSLSHEHLIRQACALTVDSTSQLLTQTMVAILEVSASYRNSMETLLCLMDESLLVGEGDQQVLWDEIVAMRAVMDHNKKILVDLNSFMEYVNKIANSAAETAFLAGAEFASTTMCERINSIASVMTEQDNQNKKLESEYLRMQEQFIKKTNTDNKK